MSQLFHDRFKARTSLLQTSLLMIAISLFTGALAFGSDRSIGSDQFILTESVNARGTQEVVVEHVEDRTFLRNTENIVLVGRDLTGNGHYDAWFYHDENGLVQGITLTGNDSDGWDAVEKLLTTKVDYKKRGLLGILYQSILGSLSIASSYHQHVLRNITQQEMDLRELEIRTTRIAEADPKSPLLGPAYGTLSDGWAEISSEAAQQGIRNSALLVIADVALYVTGTKLLEALDLGVKWTVLRLGETEIGMVGDKVSTNIESSIGKTATEATERLRIFAPSVDAAGTRSIESFNLLKLNVNDRVTFFLENLSARGRIGSFANAALKTIVQTIKGGFQNWKYIAMAQTLQVGAEILTRRDVIYNPNPIVMAHNVLSNKALWQDVMYSGADNFLMAGVGELGGTVVKKLAISAVVAVVDSNIAAHVFSQGDLDRTLIDTGWEATIGSTQTHLIDLKSLEYFEKLATKNEDPKLKLVGYAIAGLDQWIGYLGYAHVTQAYEKHKAHAKPAPVQITPIFAPN